MPKPSHCLDRLVHRSLLKYHSNSDRYSFHKLIKWFLLDVKSQNSERDNEMLQFKKGFVIYFADYWDTYHEYVQKGNYDPYVMAALDLERHNFEFMEKILPELGLDISYIKRYTESAELYASYFDSRTDYFRHIKERELALVAVEETELDLKDRYRMVMMLDLHSRAVISDKGAQHYMEIFVEMIIQVSFFEDYLHGPKSALDHLRSRKRRIIELYNEHGNEVVSDVKRFFDQMKKYCFEVRDSDALIEVLQVMIRLSWPLQKCSNNSCNNNERGRAYFGAGNYKKAVIFYNKYLKENISEVEYLYTIVIIYYCHQFNGDYHKATETVQLLDSGIIREKLLALSIEDEYIEKFHIIALFFEKVRAGTADHKLLIQMLLKTVELKLQIKYNRAVLEYYKKLKDFYTHTSTNNNG